MTAGTTFSGSIPRFYHEMMVPLMFEPYAADMAERIGARAPSAVLETAAGTGAVTRELARRSPSTTKIVATDLSQAMVDFAEGLGRWGDVTWRQADALRLPFGDESFDVVASQFGVMFYTDRRAGYREALRVLRPSGAFMFTVWGALDENEMVAITNDTIAAMFPQDPPTFLRRVPHGYADPEEIGRNLIASGFQAQPSYERLSHAISVRSARSVAEAYCSGTPLRSEIEARAPQRLAEAVDLVEAALRVRFGDERFETETNAWMVTVTKTSP